MSFTIDLAKLLLRTFYCLNIVCQINNYQIEILRNVFPFHNKVCLFYVSNIQFKRYSKEAQYSTPKEKKLNKDHGTHLHSQIISAFI